MSQFDPAANAAADADARQWAMFAHLSALLGAFVALAFLGPLVVWLLKKDAHPFVADQAREALNFNLSMLLYGVVATAVTFVLTFVLVGFLLLPLLAAGGIAWLVLVVIGGVKANEGVAFRYPFTIRFVN